MIRKIVFPQQRTYLLELPEEFIGKEVEVLAFEVTDSSSTQGKVFANQSQDERLQYLKKALAPYRVDLSNYTFDRNEANDYE